MNISDMSLNVNRVLHLKQKIEITLKKLLNVPDEQREKTREVIQLCDGCLNSVPATDTPVYVHIIGTDKSFKTSYLLDLFDNETLRNLFSVKIHNTSENTAVPCLVEPADNVDRLTIRQLSISTGQIIRDDISSSMFGKLYDLSKGAIPEDYLLQVLVPSGETPMTLPVIEYPGIKEGADAQEEQRLLHKTFQKNLIRSLEKFPGILVACFQHKVAIPLGHPMDIILKKYGEILKTDFSGHKLPLILSLQGASAITGYCGNTHVKKDIHTDFRSHGSFDTTVQLINPYNIFYPVTFSEPGPHVYEWINEISHYRDVEEIRENIARDGGIEWSRGLLTDICKNSHIQEALDNIFLKPWIIDSEECLKKAMIIMNEIDTYDEVEEIKERIRNTIIHGKYKSIRSFFKNEMAAQSEGLIEDHRKFWTSIFSQYLVQFFSDDVRCKKISETLWKNLQERLDSDKKGFLGTREEDLPYIIMNTAELYVPNALIRGDHDVFGAPLEDMNNVF